MDAPPEKGFSKRKAEPFLFLFTGWQTVFPTSFRRKPESRGGLKRFPDLPQAFAGGDEIKTWVKLSTGVEMSACSNKKSRLKANEAIPSERVPFFVPFFSDRTNFHTLRHATSWKRSSISGRW